MQHPEQAEDKKRSFAIKNKGYQFPKTMYKNKA